MVYKHAVVVALSTFMLSVVKMLLKGEVGGQALNSHGNYIVDHGISWKNHGIVFLNFFGNPGISLLLSIVPLVLCMLGKFFTLLLSSADVFQN